MTIGAALAAQTRRLRATSDSAHADATLLLAGVMQRDRAWLLAHDGDVLATQTQEAFETLCARRAAGEPVAYLLGSAWFYGHELLVNAAVLVPRPETELLVRDALAFLHQRDARDARVLDVGTGSGAIACAIAAGAPDARVDATDISSTALELAHANAARIGVLPRCVFHGGDLIAPVCDRCFDVVVANLPYVASTDLPAPPDPVAFEPRAALDGGDDGLDLYRRLVPELRSLARPGGLVLLEAGPANVAALAALLDGTGAFEGVTIERDYAGLPRYVRAYRRFAGL